MFWQKLHRQPQRCREPAEKLYTHYGSDINLNQVRDMLGITGNERIKELVEYIMGSNITAGIQTINAIKDDGFDLKQLNRELIAYLRGLLLLKTGYNSDLDFTRRNDLTGRTCREINSRTNLKSN